MTISDHKCSIGVNTLIYGQKLTLEGRKHLQTATLLQAGVLHMQRYLNSAQHEGYAPADHRIGCAAVKCKCVLRNTTTPAAKRAYTSKERCPQYKSPYAVIDHAPRFQSPSPSSIYVHTHTHAHAHLCACVCVCVCVS